MEKQAELTFEAIGVQNQMVSFCQHPHDALALFFVLCTTQLFTLNIFLSMKRDQFFITFLNNWFVWKII